MRVLISVCPRQHFLLSCLICSHPLSIWFWFEFSWELLILSKLLCVYVPFVLSSLEKWLFRSVPLSTGLLSLIYCFVVIVLYILWILQIYQIFNLKIFSLIDSIFERIEPMADRKPYKKEVANSSNWWSTFTNYLMITIRKQVKNNPEDISE